MFEIRSIDERRKVIALATPNKHKSAMGQFMTPSVIARFMVSMFNPLAGKNIRLLDAGAGIGSLTAAFAERAAGEKASSLDCEAWELDPKLHEPLAVTLEACGEMMKEDGGGFDSVVQSEDFILAFAELFARKKMAAPTHTILNPPYKKISSASAHRQALRACGIETANLYSAFVALALTAAFATALTSDLFVNSFLQSPHSSKSTSLSRAPRPFKVMKCFKKM